MHKMGLGQGDGALDALLARRLFYMRDGEHRAPNGEHGNGTRARSRLTGYALTVAIVSCTSRVGRVQNLIMGIYIP